MRNIVCVLLLAVWLVLCALPAAAQQGVTLPDNEAIAGTIDNSTYEVSYPVHANAGDFLLISMKATEDSWLDPALVLKDSQGNTVVTNDDAAATLDSVLLWEAPSDETYTIIATRAGGSTGTSEGDYTLSIDKAELLAPGSQVQVEIGDGVDYTTQVLYLESPATVQIDLSQASSGSDDYLFPFFEVRSWNDSGFVPTLVNLDETQYIQDVHVTLTLDAGFYFLNTGISVFASGERETATLSILSAE